MVSGTGVISVFGRPRLEMWGSTSITWIGSITRQPSRTGKTASPCMILEDLVRMESVSMSHRIDDVVHTQAIGERGHGARIIGVVRMLPGIAHIHIEIDGDH